MKNINFQVKFHVFCMFEKKTCFIPILVNRVGLTTGIITTMDQMRSQRGPPERAAREGRQISKCEATAKLLGLERCILSIFLQKWHFTTKMAL